MCAPSRTRFRGPSDRGPSSACAILESVIRRRSDLTRSLAVLVVFLAACSSDPETVHPPSSSPAAATAGLLHELDVETSLDLACTGTPTTGPPDNFEVVHDAVALPSSPDHPALQTSAREAADGSTYFFAKTGLIWNTESSFEIVVPADQRSRMAIGWGGPAPHAHSIAMNCNSTAEWVGLPGGYWVSEPFCADLVVRSNGEERTIQVGLGTPCDGQAGPQGPSDG